MDQGFTYSFGTVGLSTKELLARARKARDVEEYDRAADYYDDILEQEPDNWEAAYYSMFCRLQYSNLRKRIDTALSIDDAMANIIATIANANLIQQEKYYAIKNISMEIKDLAIKTYEATDMTNMNSNSFRQFKKLTLSWCQALYTVGYSIYEDFAENDWKTANLATLCLETCNDLATRFLNTTFTVPRLYLYKQAKASLSPYVEDATATIQVFDSHYVAPKVSFKFL
ncbi:MAG: hypothetical protein MJ104_01875 [Lachnospiraceae bacterium]|nr:hypothetical protein [Lachnospiraceae bacterium]